MPGELPGFERLGDACAEVGLLLERIDPALRDRLQLLAATTETVRDIQRILDHAQAFFRYYEANKPGQRFSDAEKRIVVLGSLFADIGKTGPLRANVNEQRLITEIFSIEGVRDDRQSVAQLLRTTFTQDAEAREKRFAALGLDPEMSMRAFWNLHAGWTLEILRSGHVPSEAVAAAASHHLLEDVNPEAIVASDGHFAVEFGDNIAFDRAEKLVILLDKYDAIRRRSGGDHTQAIAWLRARIAAHPRFRGDAEFVALLEDLDAAAIRA